MPKSATIIGWKLPEAERKSLLSRFPPKYENVVADHVTLRAQAKFDTPLPEAPRSSSVIGRADDGRGVECLVVALDGSSDRPDGSTYHITWSLGSERKARESNDVFATKGGLILGRPSPCS